MSPPAPDRSQTRHRPVMPREVLEWLDLEPGLTVVDGTVGGGGHSKLILQKIGSTGHLIGLDRDPMMLAFAGKHVSGDNVHLVQSSYARVDQVIADLNLDTADRMLVDLGLSSDQLSDDERGFGFESTGPLDLRFDTSTGVPASEWIAGASIPEIESALTEYGEEPFSGRIARSLSRELPQTGVELSEVVARAIPASARNSARKNPATRVFQALRIVVNAELDQLKTALHETIPRCLRPGGRLVAISFHSLEDRLLKLAFQGDPSWRTLTGKPLTPTPSEARNNPRSRSARIRVAQRT